jgi:hypothetical protein
MSEISVDNLGDDDNSEVVPFVEPAISPISGLHGFTSRDIKYPTLSIIHGVGPNFAKFPKSAGELIYNNELLIPKPIDVTFYGSEVVYMQNLSYDPTGPRANQFSSAREVIAAGGNLKEYVKAGQDDNNYIPTARCFIVLFAPKSTAKVTKPWYTGLDLAFPNGTETMILGSWILRGSAYRAIVPMLIMSESRLRKEGKTLAAQRFKLDVKHQKMGDNFVFVPVLTKVEKPKSPET